MKKRLLLLALLPVAIPACASTLDDGGLVSMRVENTSGVDFDRVVVGFPEDEVDYGAVAAGGVSGYREVERAYPYAMVEVVIDDETLRMQPIDYVGEELLEPGRYTYVLDLRDGATGATGLELTLRRDR